MADGTDLVVTGTAKRCDLAPGMTGGRGYLAAFEFVWKTPSERGAIARLVRTFGTRG
jgi:hypothetical protein